MAFSNKASVTFDVLGVPTTVDSNTVLADLGIALSIVKTQSKTKVISGDTQKYSFVITNLGLATTALFSDTIPAGMTYKTGTFKVNSVAVIPTIAGQTLTYNIPTIAVAGIVNVEFDCLVS